MLFSCVLQLFRDLAVRAIDGVAFYFIIPVISLGDISPFRHSTAKMNACEVIAIFKRTVPDVGNAHGNRDALEVRAILKRTVLDAQKSLGKRDACKIVAILKRALPDAYNPLGNGKACQGRTVSKCRLSE